MSRDSRHIQGMPLYLWGVTFLVAILLISVIKLGLNYRTKYILIQHKEITEYNFVKDESIPLFYFIGSSLTMNALVIDSMLQTTLVEKGFKPNIKIDIIGSSTLDDFNGQIDQIRRLRPHYLFIESNLACLNLISNFRGRLVQVPRNMLIELKKHFRPSGEEGASAGAVPLAFDFDHQEVDLSGTIYDVRKIDDFPKWDSLFAEASDLGIQIFLIEIPRSAEAEQQMLDEILKRQQELIGEYYQKYNIGFINFPDKISREKYYIDRAHFNTVGSRYYSEWLIDTFCNRNILNCDEWTSNR